MCRLTAGLPPPLAIRPHHRYETRRLGIDDFRCRPPLGVSVIDYEVGSDSSSVRTRTNSA